MRSAAFKLFPQRWIIFFCLVLSALSAKSYPGAIVVLTNIAFNGNGNVIDSFDSSDPYHSDWQTSIVYHSANFGTYPTNPMASSIGASDVAIEPYKRKDNAVVATTGNSLFIQNTYIAGDVETMANGTISVGANGVVGDVTWTFVSPRSGIQEGHVQSDMPTNFPNARLPVYKSGNTAVSNLINWVHLLPQMHGPPSARTTNYEVTVSGWYCITNDINGKNNNTTSPVQVNINCDTSNVVLWVPTGINLGTGAAIVVSNNCDLTLYVGSTNGNTVGISLSAQGSINNQNQYAPALAIFGLPTCTSIDFGGAASFAGDIYAPQANMSIGGGGSTTYDFVGAITVKNFNYGGRLNFHYDEAIAGLMLYPKLIAASPASRLETVGSNVTFNLSTTPGSAVAYRWFFNQTNLLTIQTNFSGAVKNVSFTLTNAQMTNAGNYTVVLSNTANLFGPLTSSIATLTMGSFPVITVQPTNLTIWSGYDAAFSVTVTSTVPVNYQWRLQGTNIVGATNSSLVLTNVQGSQTGSYSVTVTNAFGSALSTNALLLVVVHSPLLVGPTNQTVTAGGSAVFSVDAYGSLPMSYQWMFNGAPLSGETNASLVLNNVQSSDAGNYSVFVMNGYGSTNSIDAVLTVDPAYPPVIVVQPSNQIVRVGGTAVFSVTVTGTPPIICEWKSGPFTTLATGTTWTITNVQASDMKTFLASVSGPGGFAYSDLVSLAVYTNVPVIDSVNISAQGTFQMHVTGEPGLQYAVQSSTNLVDWLPLETNSSSFYFTDSMTNLFDVYRISILPVLPGP